LVAVAPRFPIRLPLGFLGRFPGCRSIRLRLDPSQGLALSLGLALGMGSGQRLTGKIDRRWQTCLLTSLQRLPTALGQAIQIHHQGSDLRPFTSKRGLAARV